MLSQKWAKRILQRAELNEVSLQNLCAYAGVSTRTVRRWLAGECQPMLNNLLTVEESLEKLIANRSKF